MARGNMKLASLLGYYKAQHLSVQYEFVTRENREETPLLVYGEEALGKRHRSGNTRRRTTAYLLEDERKHLAVFCAGSATNDYIFYITLNFPQLRSCVINQNPLFVWEMELCEQGDSNEAKCVTGLSHPNNASVKTEVPICFMPVKTP